MSTRPPLSRERVLTAAVDLADRDGLEAVTMRALAADLGVVPMALYKHVADKADLRAGMIDLVVGRFTPPAAETPWRAAVRLRIAEARAAQARHRWLRVAIESATRRTPTVLDHLEALADDLVRGGFSLDLVHHGLHALGPRVWGYAPEAFAPPPGGDSVSPGEAERAALVARYPRVAGIAADTASRTGAGCDDDAEFEQTLEMLLDALARLRDSGWESRPRQSVPEQSAPEPSAQAAAGSS